MKKLTPPQKRVADEFIKHGNKTKAGQAGRPDLDNPESARSYAVRTLRNDTVQAYIQNQAERSAENIAKLANSGRHDNVTLRANQDILDRAGYKVGSDQGDNKPANTSPQHLELMLEALKSGDAVTLERIVFNG